MEKIDLTIEEVIETIKSNYPTSGYFMLRTALDTSIELLEKQIPQAVDTDYVQYNNTEDSVRVFVCPKCTEYLDTDWDYCPSCGQRLKWK